MTWPQAAHLRRRALGRRDAKLNARILQWDYAQTLRDPLHLYQLNFFHPAKYVLAFSENLYGVALFGFPLLAAGASALVNYNVLLLLGMFLSALAAWALAREVTGDPIASAVAGLVFAFLPWRFSQLPHLQFQWARVPVPACCSSSCGTWTGGERGTSSLYGICLCVERPLQRALRAVLGVARRCDAGPVRRRRRRGEPPRAGRAPSWRRCSAGLVFVPFALPYREASRLYGMRRYFGEMRFFSARWFYFLSAGDRNWLYGHATAAWRGPEGDLFPGLLAVALAAAAVVQLLRAGTPRIAGRAADRLRLAAAARARSGRRDPAARRRLDLVPRSGRDCGSARCTSGMRGASSSS